MTEQLTIFQTVELPEIPEPVRAAIAERIKHTGYVYTMASYWRRAYACRERWPVILMRMELGDLYYLKRQAKELREWLESKNDPTRHQWVELAMLEWALKECEK